MTDIPIRFLDHAAKSAGLGSWEEADKAMLGNSAIRKSIIAHAKTFSALIEAAVILEGINLVEQYYPVFTEETGDELKKTCSLIRETIK